MEKFSRRRFITLIPAGIILSACSEHPARPSFAFTELHQKFINDPDPHPVYRGATISILTADRVGQASLLKLDNNRLAIYTVGHVANNTLQNEAFANIPGVGLYPLKKEGFKQSRQHPSSLDIAVSYELFGEAFTKTMQAVRSGRISAFTFSDRLPFQEEKIIVPRLEKGKWTVYQYVGKYTHQGTDTNVLEFKYLGGEIGCEGTSGNPLIRLEEGLPKNIMYGLVHGTVSNTSQNTDTSCSKQMLGIMNPPPNNR